MDCSFAIPGHIDIRFVVRLVVGERVHCRLIHEILVLCFLFGLKCFDLFLAEPHLVLEFVVRVAGGVVEEGLGVFGVATVTVHGGHGDFSGSCHGK